MNDRGPRLPCALLVLVACAAVYAGVRANGFVSFDDNLYVTENEHVLAGLRAQSVGWAFTAFHSANWHPLTWLSHMADVELFGLDAGAHHLVSVGLHGLNGLLLLAFLLPYTSRGAALLVALLFVVHPLRVESVAWISERKDVLAGTFFFLTLLAWSRYGRRPAAGAYLAALVAFGLGLMAKPMLVTLPCVLILVDLWPLGRRTGERSVDWGRLILEKVPFLALSAASSVVTFLAQGRAVRDLEVLSFGERLLATPLAYVEYLRATVWPAGLACLYPHWSFDAAGLSPTRVAAAAALLAGVTVLAFVLARRAPWFTVGWLWFAGMLVPVIGLVQVGSQAWADRYAYLPTVGLYLIAVEGLRRLGSGVAARRAAALAGASVVLGLAAAARAQVATWHDSETLWRRAIAVTENNAVAHNSLALELQRRGELEEAEREFRAAIALNPGYLQVRVHLARLLASTGREAEALAEYRRLLWVRPNYVPALNNLGALLLRLDRPAEALRHLERAVGRRPRFAEAHLNLALAELRLGRPARALESFRRGFALAPPPPAAALRCAWLLATASDEGLRDGAQALRWARYAVARGGRDARGLRVLAAALAETGAFGEARALQRRVVDAGTPEVEADRERLAAYDRGEAWRE